MDQLNTKLPTDKGFKTIAEILDSLAYSSYAANRDYGMSHERLVKLGIGNESFLKKYEEGK